MNRTSFKQRMQSLKTYREQNPGKGYWEWRNSLPDNLKYTDDSEYDMQAAYKSGAQPVLEDDELYHLPSRDPKSGRILKSSYHNTYWKALEEDAKLGYKPIMINGNTYTKRYDDTWAFQNGGEKLPTIGKTTTDLYGNKTHYIATSIDNDGTVNLGLPDVVITPKNNLSLEGTVNKGRKVVGDMGREIISTITPLGDVESVYQIGKDVINDNYKQAVLEAGLILLPNIIEKPVKKLIPRKVIKELSLDNIKNWTDEDWDINYNQAIEENNKDKIQKIRDLHFMSKAPDTKIINNNGDIKPLYRWDDDEFFIFDKTKQGTKYKPFYGKGFYFTGSKYFANWFGNKHPAKKYLINSPKIEKVDWDKTYKNNYINGDYNDYGDRYISNIRYNIPRLKNKTLDEYVISEPNQIKSANPITYDDTGKIIPISKRDDFTNPDIRYGLIPLIGFSALNYNNDENIQKYKDGGEVEPPYPQFINGQRVNRITGKPIATGQAKPLFDLEDFFNFTPVGDAITVKDTYNAAKQNDWSTAALSALTLIPFVPTTVKQFNRKYKGVTPKVKREIPTVNKNQVQEQINDIEKERLRRSRLINEADNQGYKIAERLMEDPAYIKRAAKVQKEYGDDYLTTYADILQAYNENPDLLMKSSLGSLQNGARARMEATSDAVRRHMNGGQFPGMGEYNYRINPTNMRDLTGNVTDHEWNHYVDYLKNKQPDGQGSSNLFKRMSEDIEYSDNPLDIYYGKPTEQKAYMNQLREYMFQNGIISSRDEEVSKELLQDVLNNLTNRNMDSVVRASRRMNNMDNYTKWFNSIPLLGLGAMGINKYYNQQKEK